jgi:hypothetical protein
VDHQFDGFAVTEYKPSIMSQMYNIFMRNDVVVNNIHGAAFVRGDGGTKI